MKKETTETLNSSGIVFFDADHTLWNLKPHIDGDYASKGAFGGQKLTFVLRRGVVTRIQDGIEFSLKEGVFETLNKLTKEGVIVGIISDNIYEDVERVSKLLGIWKYFDNGFINVRLWQGQADKKLMIKEIIDKQESTGDPKIVLIDDSERYQQQMTTAGFSFILSPKESFPKEEILRFFKLNNR